MLEHFSPNARKVLAAAEREARLLKHGHVATEHLLLGLLRVEDSVAARALRLLGVTHRKARRRVVALVDIGVVRAEPPLQFTPRVREVIEDAFSGAQWQHALQKTLAVPSYERELPPGPYLLDVRGPKPRGHVRVRTEQLAFALVAHGDGVAARVLADLDVDLERLAIATTSVRAVVLGGRPTPQEIFESLLRQSGRR